MNKYLTLHVLIESYRDYWKEEDAFGKFLCFPMLMMGGFLAIVIGLPTDLLVKCWSEK